MSVKTRTASPAPRASEPQGASPRIYDCYGLTLASDVAFQELPPRADAPALTLARVDDPARLTDRDGQTFTPERQTLEFRGMARFELAGPRIEITPYPTGDEPALGVPFLGPVMATALHYRGGLVLHGSAFLAGDGVHVFVGDRGAGKSTLAGCLAARGHTFYADDISCLETGPGGAVHARKGYPVAKMYEETFDAFFPEGSPVLSHGTVPYPKVRARIDRPDVPDTAPLAAVHMLERGDTAGLRPLKGGDAFAALMRHSYMLKYGDAPFEGARNGLHFTQVAAAASAARVGILTVPQGLDRIAEIEPVLGWDR